MKTDGRVVAACGYFMIVCAVLVGWMTRALDVRSVGGGVSLFVIVIVGLLGIDLVRTGYRGDNGR